MKDYYIILGLPKGADKSRIKKAYRDLAKKLHPDKSTSRKNRKKFMEAKEAYETLTDDIARQKYDRELEQRQTGLKINKPSSFHKGHAGTWATTRGRSRHTYSSVNKKGPPYHRDYWLEITITPGQARYGVNFTVTLPFFGPCPWCRGTGRVDVFICHHCSGRSYIYSSKEFIVTLPAHLEHGDTFRQLAYDNDFMLLYLNVLVRLSSNSE